MLFCLRFLFYIMGLYVITLKVFASRTNNARFYTLPRRNIAICFLFRKFFFLYLFKGRFSIPCNFSFALSRSCGVGVLIFRSCFLRDAFSLCDLDGRILVYSCFVGHAKFRVLSVYPPARASASKSFFSAVFFNMFPTMVPVCFAGTSIV